MNIDVGSYVEPDGTALPIGVVDADRLLVGGPKDGTTIRFPEGHEPNGDGSFRVVRVDEIRDDSWDGLYRRKWLSPRVVVYIWHPSFPPLAEQIREPLPYTERSET